MLHDSWIEKLFQKFEDFYGAKWAAQYGDFPRQRVKQTWAEELAGFADMGGAIAQALSAQKESPFPPTLPEFLKLCRDAARRMGASGAPALEHRQTIEERERAAELSKRAVASVKAPSYDGLLWAKKPKSQLAMNMVADAKKHSNRFPALAKVFDQLVIDGVCDELGKLISRWDGLAWVKA